MGIQSSNEVVFFFGAGASAPFGIPTMRQLVPLFENELESFAKYGSEQGFETAIELKEMYKEIKETLETKLPKERIDLEAVFTVINGIIDYKPEHLDLMSLYAIAELREDFANQKQRDICSLLRSQFQDFVKMKCSAPETPFSQTRLGEVYQDFFNKFASELPSPNASVKNGDYCWNSRWTMFTTNYDLCLEHYWYTRACAAIDLAFEDDKSRNVKHMVPSRYLREDIGIQLFKLHGSVNWFIEKETGEIIEQDVPFGESLLGRQIEGEMMIYPIAEKQLYLDPYLSMLLRLNKELERKRIWVVIGYSFNDPIIQTIFLKKSKLDKHLILVNPNAQKVYDMQLQGFDGKKSLINKRFGLDDFKQVNDEIIHELAYRPSTYDF